MRIIQLLLLFIASGIAAKAQQYSFYFPEANKLLPQQFIYATTTDHLGYLWAGTGEGLVKFDGNRIIPVKIGNGTANEFCTALLHHNKQIIAGFYDGSVAIGAEEKLTPLKTVAGTRITGFVELNNRLYTASQHRVFEIQNKQLVPVCNLGDDVVIEGISSCTGEVVLATTAGLYRIRNGKAVLGDNRPFHNIYNNGKDCYALSDSSVYRVSTAGTTLVYTYTAGVFASSNAITGTASTLFIPVDNRLLQLRLDTAPAVLQKTFNISGTELSVRSICQINGQLWLGTYGNGLACFNPETWSSYSSFTKQVSPTVSLITLRDYLVEVTASSVNLFRYDQQGIPVFPAVQSIPTGSRVTTAGKISETKLLMGTESGKLLEFDQLSKKISAGSVMNRGLPGKSILAVNRDKNSVFVAVAYNGVYQFDDAGKLLNHYTTANGLLHNDIYKTFTDREGYIWFVSRSSGLAILMLGEFQYLTLRDGLSSLEFTDITQDADGKIWLSTEGGGLTGISKGEIRNYDLESGLSSDYFYGVRSVGNEVYAWSRGSINVLVNDNLRRIDSREIGITANFSPRSIATGENWIAIGSEYGPVVQYLGKIFQQNSLKILVKKVLVNDEKRYSANTEFSYGDYKMEFEVEPINLDPFFKPVLEFKLEGHDKEWQTLDRQSVIYQSLKDNDYTFIVRDKLYPTNSFSFSYSVDEPFWKKPGYYLLFLGLLVIAIYIFVKFRLKQLYARNRELEQKVSERTTELRKKNTELEQFTFAMSHDLKNPAINMVELVRLLQSAGSMGPEMTEEIVSQLNSVSNKMLNNLLDLIDLLKFSNTRELPKEEVSLQAMVANTEEAIAGSIREAHARIIIDFDAFNSVLFNRSNLQSIFQNLISNAVKYRKPDVTPEITIKSFVHDGRKKISFSDNGLGIDLKANSERLFGIFQRMHHHVEGSGIGLHLVKSIMEKHGGSISVRSAPGEGTTFILEFEP
ncbi:MAG: ATP-binding protein [Bacteroidota bacterium]